MNYHNDEWIMEQVTRHWNEALKLYPKYRIVGVFLQGSQNYDLDYENSDVDTKCIVLPSWDDIVLNKKPISTTHVLDNDEHLDVKDIRLMFNCFRKQNVNFLEILFTKYKIINPDYSFYWNLLINHNEEIAHYNEVAAIRTMAGMCKEKYHALEHPYPSKLETIEKYGYDPKQLHHLVRMTEYIQRYRDGESYEACLKSNISDKLQKIKAGCYDLQEARNLATLYLCQSNNLYQTYKQTHEETKDEEVDELLNKILSAILKFSIQKEWDERKLKK